MTLREALKFIPGLDFVINNIHPSCAKGQRRLMQSPWLTSTREIEELYADQRCWENVDTRDEQLILMQMRDISGTLTTCQSGKVLDEIEIYEIKAFALLIKQLKQVLTLHHIARFPLPDLENVIEILDPGKTGVAHFYIYDSYSEELTRLREEYKTNPTNELYSLMTQEEDRIKAKISEKLRPWSSKMIEALDEVGKIDLSIAKVNFNKEFKLREPAFCAKHTFIKAIRNLVVEDYLHDKGEEFQPVDIQLRPGVTVITGANMAGKTVILKSLAMVQAMAQFGFYVPCEEANLMLVDEIKISMGDTQNVSEGLSSFAAEMLKIDGIIKSETSGAMILALIDEPARTTNPIEGQAIVNALISRLTSQNSITVITTHYNGLTGMTQRLRVKGFIEDTNQIFNVKEINKYIDYTLIPDNDSSVPQEALRIAKLMGFDAELISLARKKLEIQKK